MTSERTRRPIAGLWTVAITLLLLLHSSSGSVHSQLNAATPAITGESSTTVRSESVVASSGKLEAGFEKMFGNNDSSHRVSEAQRNETVEKSDRLEEASLEAKNIDELAKIDSGEARTTIPPSQPNDGSSEKQKARSTENDGGEDFEAIDGKKNREKNPLNDDATRKKKVVKEAERDIIHGNDDYKSVIKSNPESPTNVISSGSDGDPKVNLRLGVSNVATEIGETTNRIETEDINKTDNLTFFDIPSGMNDENDEKINQFVSNFDKTRDSESIGMKTSDFPRLTEIKEEKFLKPYIEVNERSTNYSESPIESDRIALENTIGRRITEEQILVTESSSVVDENRGDATDRSSDSSTTSSLTYDDASSTTESTVASLETIGENFGVSGTNDYEALRENDSRLETEETTTTTTTTTTTSNGIDESIVAITKVARSDEKYNDSTVANGTADPTTTENNLLSPIENITPLSIATLGDDVTASSIDAEMTEASQASTDTRSIGTTTLVQEQFTASTAPSIKTRQFEVSSIPEAASIETTTSSNVEYQFVELTESTEVARENVTTTVWNILTVQQRDFSSSTSSPYFVESSLNTSWLETTTVDNEEIYATVASTTTETSVTDDFSIVDETETTTNTDFLPSTNETTMEMIYSTNFTSIAPDESTANIPEISTNLESSSTASSSTVSSNLSIVDSTREFSGSSGSPSENWSESTMTVATMADSSSTAGKDSIRVVTVGNATTSGNGAASQEEFTSLVRIIFEGNPVNVCPHLQALRQSLADLLTSGLEKNVLAGQIIFQKNPCTDSINTESSVTTLLLYVVDKNGNLNTEMTKILPSLYSGSPIKLRVTIHSFQLVRDADSGNAIAVVVVSCVALVCLVILAGLLFIMRKRQTRFNYGERCRPVSLDAYSLDSVSAYNSVRGRGKAPLGASKRSYGNPTFEDSTATPSHPLNFAGLSSFCNERNKIAEEFTAIPQVTARIDELPQGAEVKNRYANVVPLPETRVTLMKINDDPLTEYINASYVRGPKNATKYYIACQAPMESTVKDFWRMIWEQRSKVVIMLTDLVENGVEKCAEYVPPSEVTDCHRLFGDFQVTLKKRETKEKYAISTLRLKNLERNTFREIWHIWYLWPANQSDAAGLIAVLLEARALQRGGPGPVVVHCSPGTGRTGTLIALDLGIRQYEITRTVDVPRVVCTIRRDRAGAVQTKEQYAFVYEALNLYASKLAGGAALESQ